MLVDILMTGKTVAKCPGNLLTLQCSSGYVIDVTRVELGETECYTYGARACREDCIKPTDCTRPPSDGHMNDVYSQCNGRQSCDIKAVSENNVCGGWNEFERITYNCAGRFYHMIELSSAKQTLIIVRK